MSIDNCGYKFSFGPWNIHEGADPFGPAVRESVSFNTKLAEYKKLGFEGVQFHDDDVVPNMNNLTPRQIIAETAAVKNKLNNHGLTAEFVAPRLWEDLRTIDGGYTSNDPACRKYAIERSFRCIDIANALGTNLIVFWLAREGTYIREAKNSKTSVGRIVDAINQMLDYDPDIKIAIEAKPNEPMDHTYIPTIGHAIGLGLLSKDSSRVGALIESAHAILAGLDPSDEMGYALAHNKLWSVHLNDQNGLKFDQDKTFGGVDIRRAFNQVRILEQSDYASTGAFIGLDVKAMRTQKADVATKHLWNSRKIFLHLIEKVRTFDLSTEATLIAARDYEGLELLVVNHLMGVK